MCNLIGLPEVHMKTLSKWVIFSQPSISYFRHTSSSKKHGCALLYLGKGAGSLPNYVLGGSTMINEHEKTDFVI